MNVIPIIKLFDDDNDDDDDSKIFLSILAALALPLCTAPPPPPPLQKKAKRMQMTKETSKNVLLNVPIVLLYRLSRDGMYVKPCLYGTDPAWHVIE